MDILSTIAGRRSIRKFKPEKVNKEVLEKLIKAAVWAPSGGNAQTWRFVIVTDSNLLSKIKLVSPGLLGDPPAVIIIAQDMELAKKKGGRMGCKSLAQMDSAMAAQNILLTAYTLGLGTCVIASFHPAAVGRLVGFPEKIQPLLMVSVGKPAVNPRPPARRTDGVIWWELYDRKKQL